MSSLLCLYLLLIVVRFRELVVLMCDVLMLPSRKVSSSIVFYSPFLSLYRLSRSIKG
jgi:hypothetical protein